MCASLSTRWSFPENWLPSEMLPWPWVLPRKETVVDVLCCRSRFIPQCHRGWMPREIIFIGIKQQGSETQENTWQSHPHSYYNRCMTLPGSSKNNHPHIHGFMELFATPCPPNQCWAHRVYMTAFKKATILVTRVSLCHLLQHWVGGAWGAATALLDVDVVVFFSERGGQENACAAFVCLCGVEVVPELVSVTK